MKESNYLTENRPHHIKSFLILLFAGFLSCNDNGYERKSVDFSKREKPPAEITDTSKYITMAVGAMISPQETYYLYKDLFEYVSAKLNKKLKFEQRKTYSDVNELIKNNQVDVGFICTGAYFNIINDCEMLVAPVVNGKPYYQAYIIVNANSDIYNFEDLRVRTFAFTDPISNTGKSYPEKRIRELFNQTPGEFFDKIIYSHSHDASIQLVSKEIVDGASVDGLIFDYLYNSGSKDVKNLRIIEKSRFFGIPPVVSSKKLNQPVKEQIIKILLSMDSDPEGQKILKKLFIDKFVIPEDTIYKNTYLYYDSLSQCN